MTLRPLLVAAGGWYVAALRRDGGAALDAPSLSVPVEPRRGDGDARRRLGRRLLSPPRLVTSKRTRAGSCAGVGADAGSAWALRTASSAELAAAAGAGTAVLDAGDVAVIGGAARALGLRALSRRASSAAVAKARVESMPSFATKSAAMLLRLS